jgi:proteasome endopeptidase complex, beta component (EC 3.4.25.1). Threonine peptidase. MEROPS family T01A
MNKEFYEKIKSGTTTIGIICKDGVVMAADARATNGHVHIKLRSRQGLLP